MQKYIYSESLSNTLYIELTQKLKKFLSDETNITKNALYFLSRAPNYNSFILNSQLL